MPHFLNICPELLHTFCLLILLRKSYEFEDVLQSSTDGSQVDWYAQARLSLTRTLSEENIYEDILGKPPRDCGAGERLAFL